LLWKNTLIYYSSSNATEAYLHRRNGRANIDRLTSFHVVDTNIVLFIGMITVLSFNPGSIVELLSFWWLIGQGVQERSSV